MTKDEALKLALEALVLNNAEWKALADSGDAGFWEAEEQDHYKQTEQAITAIKEALADPSPNFNCKSVQARLATAWGFVKAQPEQEPVTWGANTIRLTRKQLEQFYPPQRKPLTDEEIKAVCAETWSYDPYVIARAIEAAHSIKGEA